MRRHELTDFEWKVIEPLLPNKTRGVPRVNDRRVLNGRTLISCWHGRWRCGRLARRRSGLRPA